MNKMNRSRTPSLKPRLCHRAPAPARGRRRGSPLTTLFVFRATLIGTFTNASDYRFAKGVQQGYLVFIRCDRIVHPKLDVRFKLARTIVRRTVRHRENTGALTFRNEGTFSGSSHIPSSGQCRSDGSSA